MPEQLKVHIDDRDNGDARGSIKTTQVGAIQTALLVESSELLLESLRQLLENDHYQVLSANSAEAALVACQQHQGRIDLLITDITTDEMNGLYLAVAVASAHAHVAIVFTVAPPSSLKLKKSNCDVCLRAIEHFLPKPFPYSLLQKKLVQLRSEGHTPALEWLLHFYDRPVPPEAQTRRPPGEKEPTQEGLVMVQLKAVERKRRLVVTGALLQKNGAEAPCSIELQVKTARGWRRLRFEDLDYMTEPILRLTIQPAVILNSEKSKDIIPLQQAEKEAILSALTALNGDKVLAASRLGIGRSALYGKLKKHGITMASMKRS
jgi:DNA-binding NtrC family response regulator